MSNPLAQLLNRVGLYRPLKRATRYVQDPGYRRYVGEVRSDLARTRRELSGWGREGVGRADPDRLYALLSFTRVPFYAKIHGLVGKSMQLQGYTPVVFTYSGLHYAHRYYRLFGIDRMVFWDHEEARVEDDEVQAAFEALPADRGSVRRLMACQFRGVDVGKHALSMTCRERVEGRLDLRDYEVVDRLDWHLRRGIRSVMAAERVLRELPIEKMLVRDSGYVPMGSIYEAALERGVDCVIHEFGQRRGTWIFKRHTVHNKSEHYFSLSDETWDRIKVLPWTDDDERRLEREFAGRYHPESTDDTRRLMHNKTDKPAEKVRAEIGLDPSKKTAVIFSHLAWDAAFFYGSCIFDDFEDWLFKTVEFVARECPDMNWIVKLHPFNALKLQREDKDEESEMRLLRSLMPLPDHVRIVRASTDISTRSLFPLVDYVLTVNGTVGMEFPCFGVPAVVAGTGRYDGRGFTIEPKTPDEYFETLRSLHDVAPLDAEAQSLAKRHFLSLMTGRQTSLEDVAPMELRRFNEAQSDVHNNIGFASRSLAEFEGAPSVGRLSRWLAHAHEPDILEPGTVPVPETAAPLPHPG